MSRRSPRRRRPLLDRLEPRRLLSFASLSGGTLTVTGTLSSDAFTVSGDATSLHLTLAGQTQSFALAQITAIEGSFGNGDDAFALPATLNIPATLSGEAGNDTLAGGAANDALFAGSGNDVAFGNAGNDTIELATGDDTLDGGTGNDTLDGGDGVDTITYASRTQAVTATLDISINPVAYPATQPFYSSAGSGGVSGETDQYVNAETLVGGVGGDQLGARVVTPSSQWYPEGATYAVRGGPGNDSLSVSGPYLNANPHLVADGGDGNDSLGFGDGSGNRLIGGNGDDTFDYGNDDSGGSIDAGPGFDSYTYRGHDLNYTMPAGLEKLLAYGIARTVVTGNDEDNVIFASGNAVTVHGGGGNDDIRQAMSGGPAFLSGDAGNDTLIGGVWADTLDGGSGDDRINGGTDNDTLIGGGGNDTLSGDDGRDRLYGNAGNDRLNGNGGSDRLYGGDGTDRLYGSAGNDYLDGEGGRDYLYGDAGIDTAKQQKTDRHVEGIELFI